VDRADADQQQKLLVVANFAEHDQGMVMIKLPSSLIDAWQLDNGEYTLTEQLDGNHTVVLSVANGIGELQLSISSLSSMILQLN
jgi:hypothetical protein